MRFIVAAALALAAAAPGPPSRGALRPPVGPSRVALQRPGAQSTPPDLLARVSAYVGDFYRRFGSIVAEERYQQTIRRSPGSIGTTLQRGGGGPVSTTLVSDFLLVQVP